MQVRMHFRAKARKKAIIDRAAPIDEVKHPLQSKDNPFENVVASELMQSINRAVEKLTPRQRLLFLSRNIEQLNVAETAAVTGLSISTVKNESSRAMNAVREILRNGNGNGKNK